jgi:hypothetical protein
MSAAAAMRRSGAAGVVFVRPMSAIRTLTPASNPEPSVRNLASSRRVM